MMEIVLVLLGMSVFILLAIPVSVCTARYFSEKDDKDQILDLRRH